MPGEDRCDVDTVRPVDLQVRCGPPVDHIPGAGRFLPFGVHEPLYVGVEFVSPYYEITRSWGGVSAGWLGGPATVPAVS